jgi:hypothetical protein
MSRHVATRRLSADLQSDTSWHVVFRPSAEKELGRSADVGSSRCAACHREAGGARAHAAASPSERRARWTRPEGVAPASRPQPDPAAVRGRVGNAFVILTIGPEALVDRRGFDRAVRIAEQRLTEVEE